MNKFEGHIKNSVNILSIKSEIEIKEEPLESHEEYLTENDVKFESVNHHKKASEICTDVLRVEKPCGSSFGKIEVKHEESFDEVHDAIIEDNDYDMKADVDVKNEDIEDLIEDESGNSNNDVILKEFNFSSNNIATPSFNLDSTMIDNQLTASNLEYIFNEVDQPLNKHCKIFENGILIEKKNKLHRLQSKRFLSTNTMENNSFYDSDSGKSKNIGSSSASEYIPPSSASEYIPPSSASEYILPSSASVYILPSSASEYIPPSSGSVYILPSSASVYILPSSASEYILPSSASEYILPSSASEYILPSSASEYIPPSSASKYIPPSSASEYIPPSSASEYIPPSSASEYIPPSSASEYILPSSASEYIPPSSASEYIPPSSAGSEEIPIQWKIVDKNLRPTPESDTLRSLREKNEANEPVPGVSSKPSSESSVIISTDGHKQQACYFCEKLVSRMGRHYLEQHRTKKEVIEIHSYPAKHHQRKVKLERLRLEGNFKHNINVLKNGVGTLFVVRRSKLDKQKRTQDYIPCINCLGFFYKRVLWKHFKACKYGKSATKKVNVVQLGYSIIAQHVNHGCGEFGKAFARMRQDEISKAARDDDLINKFCVDLEKKKMHHKDVSNKARQLGRFLLKLKEMFGADRDLKSFLKPSEFDCLIKSARELSYSSDCDDQKPYTLGIKIGQSLKKCCSIAKIIAIKKNETELRSNIEGLETLLSDNWSTEISIPLEFRVKKLEEMPLTDDLVMLSKHLTGQVNSLTQKLEKDTSLKVWRELATCSLANLILYNKKREGEVAKTLLRDFVERPCWQDINIKEITQSLSKMEQEMQSKLDLMKIRGKRGRRVTILITVPMKSALEILTKTRDEVGILKENPYFFANSKLEYLRGGDSLAYYMKKCNVKRPDLITSCYLQKYVATVSQIMNMEDHEMELFLGHDINIHRKFYRLQDGTIELTKVSKFLMAIDLGKAYKVSGKSIDEINNEIDLNDLIKEANKYDDEGQIMDVEEASDNEEKQKEINDVLKKKNDLQKEKEAEMKVGKYQQKILNKSMKKEKGMQKRQRWDEDIKKIALQYFKINIENKTPPRQLECLAFLNGYEVKNRTWRDVKSLIFNSYNIRKK